MEKSKGESYFGLKKVQSGKHSEMQKKKFRNIQKEHQMNIEANKENKEKLPDPAKVIDQRRRKESEKQQRLRALSNMRRMRAVNARHDPTDRHGIVIASSLVVCPFIFQTLVCIMRFCVHLMCDSTFLLCALTVYANLLQ